MSRDWIPLFILIGVMFLWAFTSGREVEDDKELVSFYARRRKK